MYLTVCDTSKVMVTFSGPFIMCVYLYVAEIFGNNNLSGGRGRGRTSSEYHMTPSSLIVFLSQLTTLKLH